MVKLLRFTSEDNNGIFTATLDQELRIPPNSKIALASCALEIQRDKLVIDSSNHEIRFQILTGAIRTIQLNHTNGVGDNPDYYDSSNYQLLFDDITLKMNNAIGSTLANGHIEFGSEIGKQAEIKKDRNGKIEIKLNSVGSKPYGTQLDINTPSKLLEGATKKVVVIQNPDSANSLLFANTATAQGSDSYLCTTFQTHPIAKGCGVHRMRFKGLFNNGVTATRGAATISLGPDPSDFINSRDFLVSDISFGIKAVASFGGAGGAQDGTYHFKLPNTADFVPGPVIPISATGNDNTKDVMSIEIVGDRVRGLVYRDDGANPTIATLLFDTGYDNSKLYGSYSLHGAGKTQTIPAIQYGCRVDQLRYTPDPFLAALDPTIDTTISHDDTDTPLSNSTPTVQAARNSNHDLNFTGDEVSGFLGYDPRRQPRTGFISGRFIVIFTGQFLFKSTVINDCFMIEMLNLSVESYDFHSTQRKRKNLLAVLPFDDTADKCIFQPNTLAYLDLFNKDEYFTSEIKLRIIRGDYGSVELSGLSTVVIYLD
mgnify:CR=1 FL=1|tara:strand:+ start:263 stop:1882 length:1620 start_codon:yes stop_codon:yes gene_type:complete